MRNKQFVSTVFRSIVRCRTKFLSNVIIFQSYRAARRNWIRRKSSYLTAVTTSKRRKPARSVTATAAKSNLERSAELLDTWLFRTGTMDEKTVTKAKK